MSRRGCKFDGGVVFFGMPGEKPGRLQGRRPVRRRARGPGRRSAEKGATSDLTIFFAAGGDDLRQAAPTDKIGRAHVCTTVTKEHHVCRSLHETNKQSSLATFK